MRKVVVHGQSLGDAELVHDHEAHAIHRTVCLVAVFLQVLESGTLVLGAVNTYDGSTLVHGGTLTLALDGHQGGVRVRVSDTGPGAEMGSRLE